MKRVFLFILYIFFSIAIFSCGKNKTINEEDKSELRKKMILEHRKQVHALLKEEEENGIKYQSKQNSGSTNEFISKINEVNFGCGTILSRSQYDKMSDIMDTECKIEELPYDTITSFTCLLYIQIVSVQNSKFESIKSELMNQISIVNEKFIATKINFKIVKVDRINSEDVFYNFNLKNLPVLLTKRKFGVLNLFIVNTLFDREHNKLTGYTTFEAHDDFIILTTDGLKDGSTFSHEMGHFFNLYHTHGKTNFDSDPYALVSGIDCSCTGDEICDTPADPNLLLCSCKECNYDGEKKDKEGVVFKPDPKNLMSNALSCRSLFTIGQYNRMRIAALRFRRYLLGTN